MGTTPQFPACCRCHTPPLYGLLAILLLTLRKATLSSIHAIFSQSTTTGSSGFFFFGFRMSVEPCHVSSTNMHDDLRAIEVQENSSPARRYYKIARSTEILVRRVRCGVLPGIFAHLFRLSSLVRLVFRLSTWYVSYQPLITSTPGDD